MPRTNWHPEDVKAAVRKTGVSLEELGRRAGVPGNTLHKSLHVPCPKGNRVVAEHLARRLCDVWPEWYDGMGKRLYSRPGKTNAPLAVRHRQKKAAA